MRYLLALIIIAIPITGTAFEVTQEHIQQAEMTRTMGKNMGFDKLSPEQMVELGVGLANDSGSETVELTEQHKKAFACLMAKVTHMQYESDIEEYARYISDKNYEDQLTNKWNKECGIDKLPKLN